MGFIDELTITGYSGAAESPEVDVDKAIENERTRIRTPSQNPSIVLTIFCSTRR